MVDMREAVNTAIGTIKDVYKDEDISDITLEEIEFDWDHWFTTVGFDRQKVKGALGGLVLPTRTLKVVKVDRHTGEFAGMKIRDPGS